MFYNWIKIAFRTFAKNKLATFINVFGLSLGLLGLIITLLYQSDQYSYDSWVPDKDRIFMLTHEEDEEFWGMSYPLIQQAQENINEIEEVLIVSSGGYKDGYIRYNGKNIASPKILESSDNYFSFFPYTLIEGNKETALEGGQNIAISEAIAKKIFGEEKALHKTVEIQDKTYVVNAVFQMDKKSSIMPEVVIVDEDYSDYTYNFNHEVYIKTIPGMDATTLQNRYETLVWDELLKKGAEAEGIPLALLKEQELMAPKALTLVDSFFERKGESIYEPSGNKTLIYVLLGVSVLLLIISIVNFINMSLASTIKRAKEIGVRKATGATRKNIIYQSLFETFILCVFSMLVAIVLTEILLPSFNQFLGADINIQYGIFLQQVVLTTLLTTLLTGIIPAIYVSKFKTIEVLKGSFSRSTKGIYLRNAMLGLQFVIATFFFIASLVVYFQISYLNNKDLGFNKEQIMVLNFDFKDKHPIQEYERVKTHIENFDGVVAVNSVRPIIATPGWSTKTMKYEGKTISNILFTSIDFGYPEIVEMQLLKGRFLSKEFASDTINNILINETFAKQLGIYEDPIDKKLSGDLNVVGMVKDYHIHDAFSTIQPTFIHHWKAFDSDMMYNLRNVVIKFKPENLNTLLKQLEAYWPENGAPNQEFQYYFLDESFAKTYEQYTKQQQILVLMTSIIILIALLGLYALASFIIEQRLKEVAIRKVLGADTKDIVKNFTKPYIIIGSISILLTFPVIYYVAEIWLQNFAYRIDFPWKAFVICFGALLLLSTVVVSIRAWNAARLKPVNYLKYE